MVNKRFKAIEVKYGYQKSNHSNHFIIHRLGAAAIHVHLRGQIFDLVQQI